MSLFEIILLAIALGVDCLVVSFCQGLVTKTNRTKLSFKMALIMGGFQALMPVIGYYFTDSILVYIYSYADIIAFIIFALLGLKFIIEAIYGSNECEVCKICFKNLILIGIATSIDALAAGVNLRLTSANLLLSVCIIGAVSFLMSQGGFWLGNYFKQLPSKVLEILGGLILIFLGIKSLLP